MNAVVDALVVGAGPAGSAAAWVLSQAGWKVRLLESADEVHAKVGESLPAASVRLLRRLGIGSLSDLLEPGECKRCTANASAWGTHSWEYRDGLRDPEGLGWHIVRHRFDAALRRHALGAGVRLVRGRACRVEKLASGFRVHIENGARPLAAHWVVDATGRRAVVARQLGSQRRRESTQLALYAWVSSSARDRDDMTRVKSVREGWWYTARLPNRCRVVAFHGLPKDVSYLRRHPQAAWRRCLESGVLPAGVAVRSTAAGEPAPGQPWPANLGWRVTDAGAVRSAAVTGDGWVAVGDAALSFDPLSSQGIFFALYSGVRAAEAILAAEEGAKATRDAEHCRTPSAAQAAIAPALAAYSQRVLSVAAANRRARAVFYAQERRYLDSRYWQLAMTAR